MELWVQSQWEQMVLLVLSQWVQKELWVQSQWEQMELLVE
jgi:hypothetical protein